MNVLIITNVLFPYLNANSSIAYTVASELKKKYNCNISILGYDSKIINKSEKEKYKNIFETVRIQSICNYYKIQRKYKSKILKIFHFVLDWKTWRFCYNFFLTKNDPFISEYKHAIASVLRKKDIDCIIAVSAPTAILKALNSFKKTPPIISYKLDPWTSNHYTKNALTEKKQEEKSDKKASAIIVTNALYSEYVQNGDNEILDKVYVLNFPCLKPPPIVSEEENDIFDKNCINCVFVGNVYRDIRNPSFAIDALGRLKDKNVRFHIFGGQFGKCFDQKDLPQNVIYHGYVSEEKAKQHMKAANILINIGNTVANQMPSKILTYISYGKPIINFLKIKDCPTMEYMSKYPLALNFLEGDKVSDEEVQTLLEFCTSQKNTYIEYEEIAKMYYECTSDFVVSKIYSIIKKNCEGKQGQ